MNNPFRFVYARDLVIPTGVDKYGALTIERDITFCYTRSASHVTYSFAVRNPADRFVKADARFISSARYDAGRVILIDWPTAKFMLSIEKVITDDSQDKINILDLKHSAISDLIVSHYIAIQSLCTGVFLDA